MSKHVKRWTRTREFADRFAPKLFPGKHRYCALIDYQPHPLITNPALFDAMAARHTGATK